MKIVSGGQTGADRAALDAAMEHGLPHGGWCPAGRRAEDGAIDLAYELVETPSADYAQRTEWNVRDSDATLILTLSPRLAGGTLLTRRFAEFYGKPCLQLDASAENPEDDLRVFFEKHRSRIATLNVAGSRESEEPGVYRFVRGLLGKWLSSSTTVHKDSIP